MKISNNTSIIEEDVETDEEYRLRRPTAIQQAKTATVEGIRTALSAVENVSKVLVFENDTMVTDAAGRPPKSVEAVVENGDDTDIANALWLAKAGGIELHGTESVDIVDSQGITRTIEFSRATEVPIYVTLLVSMKDGFDYDDNATRLAVLVYGEGLNIGDDVIVSPDMIAALSKLNFETLTIHVAKTAGPTLSNNIAIDAAEIATFASARISVVVS